MPGPLKLLLGPVLLRQGRQVRRHALRLPPVAAAEEEIRRVVTVFRELRDGATADGRTSLKVPSGSLSTAEAISVVVQGLSLAAHFGGGGLTAADLAAGMVGACLVYPFVFVPLATWSLIGGAFIACLLLLGIPLVAASAMNPLLVAIVALRARQAREGGDGGAGHVFFISTLGSVAGVLVTAFGLIPFVSNFDSLLIIAAVLSLLSLALVVRPPAELKRRGIISATGGLALAASILLLWQADAYTGRKGPIAHLDKQWHVEAELRSLFGTVKILKHEPDADGRYWRIYFQDGLTQNSVESSGRSRSFYTYALEALAMSYQPNARSALALGLGAGMTPARLAARGVPTEIVEIDSASLQAAHRFFGLDEKKTPVHHTDARTFVQRCPHAYDLAIVDLFHGDGTPDFPLALVAEFDAASAEPPPDPVPFDAAATGRPTTLWPAVEAETFQAQVQAVHEHIRAGDAEFGFLVAVTAFEAPQNVAVEALRIETWFPIDDATAAACRRLVDASAP